MPRPRLQTWDATTQAIAESEQRGNGSFFSTLRRARGNDASACRSERAGLAKLQKASDLDPISGSANQELRKIYNRDSERPRSDRGIDQSQRTLSPNGKSEAIAAIGYVKQWLATPRKRIAFGRAEKPSHYISAGPVSHWFTTGGGQGGKKTYRG